jgi:hypothetical protein
MELIKKTDNYTIYKKKSGRYAVKNKEKKYLSDKEKVEILLEEKLIKLSPRKKPEEPAAKAAPAAEEPAAEAAPAAEEPAAEEPAAEEPAAEAAPAAEEPKKK